MSNRLHGKIAVITGAGSGVGRAYAHAFAGEGAKVVVSDIGRNGDGASSAEVVAREIQAKGGKAIADQNDVSNFSAVGRMMENVIDTYERIDILISNAGIIRPRFMYEADESDWADVLAVHANGAFNCYRHAIPYMIRQNSGSIINTGAGLMQGHFPKLAAYRAAKAAILELTISTSFELKGYNININSIMPGPTATPMSQTYLASLSDPAMIEMANSMAASPESVPPLGVFLCTDEARAITGLSFYLSKNGFSVAKSMGELVSIEAANQGWEKDELKDRVPEWLASVLPDDLYRWRG